jgi:hypothetical protein
MKKGKETENNETYVTKFWSNEKLAANSLFWHITQTHTIGEQKEKDIFDSADESVHFISTYYDRQKEVNCDKDL